MTQHEQARTFLVQNFSALHHAPRGFVLPGVWDAASARLFAAQGFPALGTTSAGIAYTRGQRDGQRLSRDEMLREVGRIVRSVDLPITADLEAGYADAPGDVARSVRGALDVGAVGVNLEDGTGRAGAPLYSLEEQQRRLAAARAVAGEFVLNARVDTYFTGFGGNGPQRYEETVRRGRAYLEAGADVVFVPGVVDPPTVRALVRDLGGPLNLMVLPGAPSVPELLGLGVARVSLGPGPMLAALGLVAEIARELRDRGTYTALERSFYGFAEAEALFSS